jgi:hypothetical protein
VTFAGQRHAQPQPGDQPIGVRHERGAQTRGSGRLLRPVAVYYYLSPYAPLRGWRVANSDAAALAEFVDFLREILQRFARNRGDRMIPEIGIMIGFFILARLVPSGWRLLSATFGTAAFLVALVVVTDLGIRGFGDHTLASLLTGSLESLQGDVRIEAPSEQAQVEPEQAAGSSSTFSVTTADGGPITTNLGYGIAVAKDSSLRREWIAVHDSALPVDLEGTPGIKTIYESERYSGEYRYVGEFTLRTRASVQAIEVRFLTFDVWGNHVRSLSYEEVVDLPADSSKAFVGKWNVHSENEVERHYASIAYVARVRTADGRVFLGNDQPVLAEAKKFFAKFSAADLQPEPVRNEEGTEGRERS